MVGFAKKALRAGVYSIGIGLIFGILFLLAGSFLSAIGALPSSITPARFAMLGFGFGFTMPLALEWSKDIDSEKGNTNQ